MQTILLKTLKKDNLIFGLVDSTDYKDECDNLRTGQGVIPICFFYVISQIFEISCVVYNVEDSSKYKLISKPKRKSILLDGIVLQDVLLFNFQVVCTQFQNFKDMTEKSFVPNKVLQYNFVNGSHSNVLGSTVENNNMKKIV